MTAPGPHPQGPHNGYGFGLAVDTYHGVGRIAHNGMSLGFTAANQVYPTLSQSVIALASGNYSNASDIADAAFDEHNPQLAARDNTGVAGEDPAVTAVIKRLWSGMESGHVDQSMLMPRMGRYMAGNPGSNTQFSGYGAVERWIYRGRGAAGAYRYRLLFANGRAVDLSVVVTAQHKIDGLAYWRR